MVDRRKKSQKGPIPPRSLQEVLPFDPRSTVEPEPEAPSGLPSRAPQLPEQVRSDAKPERTTLEEVRPEASRETADPSKSPASLVTHTSRILEGSSPPTPQDAAKSERVDLNTWKSLLHSLRGLRDAAERQGEGGGSS
jgi:hypothetical protein